MKQGISLKTMQRGIRSRVCTQCWQRPPGSETLGFDVPRSCEPGCTIFTNLPRLAAIASHHDDPTLASYENATREIVCQACNANPTSGDFCSDRSTQQCPLSRYLGVVIDVLEKIEHK